jgi:hypothetical protein
MGMLINVYSDHTQIFIDTDEEYALEEQDRQSLPDRIKEAIEEYGAVYFDRETGEKYFNAKWDDFKDAIVELMKDGYTIKAYIEKENENG